jgi:hypothetical protein
MFGEGDLGEEHKRAPKAHEAKAAMPHKKRFFKFDPPLSS